MRKFILILGSLFCTSVAIAAESPVLRVGTTGDYPPLTELVNGEFTGEDIITIKQFARDTQRSIIFVQTTWSSLSADLQNGKFDMAVGGISDNAARRTKFAVSVAIEHSAKVPMVRCSDVKKFPSFQAIDNPAIIVVENKGGTNEIFAKTYIKHASIEIESQNAVAIARLNSTEHPADVMFTDDIEVNYRHNLNPLLCLANIPDKFPTGDSDKVFLFSHGSNQLRDDFNKWWLAKHQLP